MFKGHNAWGLHLHLVLLKTLRHSLIFDASCTLQLRLETAFCRWRLWSCTYLRYWLGHQLLYVCGTGMWSAHPTLLTLYYRLLGASIGSGVVIDPKAKVKMPAWEFCMPGSLPHKNSDLIRSTVIDKNSTVGTRNSSQMYTPPIPSLLPGALTEVVVPHDRPVRYLRPPVAKCFP